MKTYRVLITGSRSYPKPTDVAQALENVVMDRDGLDELVVVVHGACPTGADYWASRYVKHAQRLAPEKTWITEEPHPADWDKHGRVAGPIRNREMVEAGADLCLAFYYGLSIGTTSTVGMARASGIPVVEKWYGEK